MPCEHYKDALIEVATAGAAPQGELRAHLDECASCRAAFDEEQSLLAAIDSGLRASANADVPPSLLPRVRASLNDAAFAHPRWTWAWFAMGSAAVAAAAVLLLVATRQNNIRPTPTNFVANRTPAPQIPPPAQEVSRSTLPKKRNSAPNPVSTPRNSAQPAGSASHRPTPEILVPRDQETLLASYAQQWDSLKHPPLLAGDVDQTAALPEIPLIQITKLDVKPLAEGDSQ